MSKVLLTVPCTLLQPGYSLLPNKPVNTTNIPSNSEDLYVETVEDKYHYIEYLKSNRDICYAYDPTEDSEVDWDDWNLNDDGTNKEGVLTRQVLLVFRPEELNVGLLNHEAYSAVEYLGEGSFEEYDGLGFLLYEKIKGILIPKACPEDYKGLDQLLIRTDKFNKLISNPWIDFNFLTEWNWWSSYDSYAGDYDGGLEFVKFIDL